MPRVLATGNHHRPVLGSSSLNKGQTSRIISSRRYLTIGVIVFAVVGILLLSYDLRNVWFSGDDRNRSYYAYYAKEKEEEEEKDVSSIRPRIKSKTGVDAVGAATAPSASAAEPRPTSASFAGIDRQASAATSNKASSDGGLPAQNETPRASSDPVQQQQQQPSQKAIENNRLDAKQKSPTTTRTNTQHTEPRRLPQVVSTLLPAPLDYVRRNMSLQEIYDYPRDRRFTGDCSCENSRALQECCFRVFRRCHKMGVVMTRNTFKNIRPPVYKFSRDPFELDYTQDAPRSDYRDVLLFRNIYDALISGYQYHKLGRECWTDTKGKPMDESAGRDRWRSVYYWYKVIQYEPNPPRNGRSLCRYLEQESEQDGLRAYIEYIFHSQYVVMFSHLALAVSDIREVRQRTMVICYEDIVNPTTANTVLNRALQFFYNNATDRSYAQGPPGSTSLKEQHAAGTSLETAEKERLRRTIRDIDRKYYHNDIAWLDSIIPC